MNLDNSFPGLPYIPGLFCCSILAILFLQSSFDKILHRRANLDWLHTHFSKSPLRKVTVQLFSVLTVLELFSGLFSLAGCFFLLLNDLRPALFGVILSMTSFVALFFGQRMAQDYAGAASLIPYATFALFSFFIIILTPEFFKFLD